MEIDPLVSDKNAVSSGMAEDAAKSSPLPVILAVDDEESNLLILKRPLLKEGYSFITASSGAQALEILNSTDVDLILLDWMMPGMSGIEACRKIKSNPNLSIIPVILVTAKTGVEDLAEGLAAGANDYLKKPVERLELMARVRAGLREMSVRKELKQSNEKLRELNRMKDEFVAIVSHDLRSPLATIMGFTDLLLEDTGAAKDENTAHALQIIKKSAQWQLSLVDNLLDIAKIEAGGMELEKTEVKIGEILQQSCDSFRVNASAKNISISLSIAETEPAIHADILKISQVVNNLLSNAVKFTPKGGSVEARLVVENNGVKVSVKDSGPGIGEADMEKLFGKFKQLKTKSTAGEKGTGLGLSITKSIVELHGGSIGVKSVPGEGCEFYFTLPV